MKTNAKRVPALANPCRSDGIDANWLKCGNVFWDGRDCHIISSTRWPVHRLVTHAGPSRRTAHQTSSGKGCAVGDHFDAMLSLRRRTSGRGATPKVPTTLSSTDVAASRPGSRPRPHHAVAPRGDAVDGMVLVASQGPVPRCALGHRCELTLERWQSQRTSSCCCPLLRHLKHVSPRSDRREEHESVSRGMV